MKLTVHNFGDGATMTTFDHFHWDYGLNLITIKVECPECGHAWGIKIDDYIRAIDIPEHKFACTNCGYYGYGNNDAEQHAIHAELQDGKNPVYHNREWNEQNNYINRRERNEQQMVNTSLE